MWFCLQESYMPFSLPFLGMTNSYPSPSADLSEEGLLYMYMSAFECSHLSLDPSLASLHMLLGPGRFNVGSRKEKRKGKSIDDSPHVVVRFTLGPILNYAVTVTVS